MDRSISSGQYDYTYLVVNVARYLWRKLLRAHYADLPCLAHTRAMAAFVLALTPMLATPPARVFAATNMLVCVLLLLLLCAERLFPLPVSQGDTDFSSEWGRMPERSSRGRGSGLLDQGNHGDANAGAGMDIDGFVCSCGCVAGAFVRGVFRFDGKGPVVRS